MHLCSFVTPWNIFITIQFTGVTSHRPRVRAGIRVGIRVRIRMRVRVRAGMRTRVGVRVRIRLNSMGSQFIVINLNERAEIRFRSRKQHD